MRHQAVMIVMMIFLVLVAEIGIHLFYASESLERILDASKDTRYAGIFDETFYNHVSSAMLEGALHFLAILLFNLAFLELAKRVGCIRDSIERRRKPLSYRKYVFALVILCAFFARLFCALAMAVNCHQSEISLWLKTSSSMYASNGFLFLLLVEIISLVCIVFLLLLLRSSRMQVIFVENYWLSGQVGVTTIVSMNVLFELYSLNEFLSLIVSKMS